uniref:Trans-2,3-enoyl-CoA reductase n=1 Tax=Mus spicilegus TaxID=10103 RepID=A0A8C6GYV5_MUSSI
MPFPHRLVASQHTGTVSEARLTGQAAPVWSPAGMLLCYLSKGVKKKSVAAYPVCPCTGGRSWGGPRVLEAFRGRPSWGVGRLSLARLGDATPDLLLADPQWYPARQSLRLDPKGKSLKDEDVLQKLPVGTTATLYFRDLGAQISWVTVFLTEYAGPLFIYLLFYFRVPFIYGRKYDFTSSRHTVVHLACMCHSFHYIKRLLETLFVHRFSHGTMPLRNIFKNCTYYWGFAAWMAYYINHPLYTPPTYGVQQVKLALAVFVICQLGNFSIHMALRDLRPAGSKTRKIPYPTKNPFTWLFLLVSCPNYTYEVGSWIGFAILTQCVPVALFSLVGFTQMTIWAKGKHRSYLKEFRDYPPLRMPIIPFLL